MIAAAAADLGELEVFRRPRLHILSTGDELAEPGTARARADAIPESVSFGVAALADQWGAECAGTTRLRDDLARMEEVARALVDGVDLIVVTGGASVGEKDFAKAMFEPLGLELIFSKVSMKPGKPVWLGLARDSLVVGLPGNPTSALVTARLLLAPLLAGLQASRSSAPWGGAPLRWSHPSTGAGREKHSTGRGPSPAVLTSSRIKNSSAQKALADADLLVRQRANGPALETGEPVEVLDF